MTLIALMAECGFRFGVRLAAEARLDPTTVRRFMRGSDRPGRRVQRWAVARLARVLGRPEAEVLAAIEESRVVRQRRDAEMASRRDAARVNRAERVGREAIGLPEDDLEGMEERARSRRRRRDAIERSLATALPPEDGA